MTLLVGIGVKAKVWALARRGAHSFLTMRTVLGITALCCGDYIGLYIISDCIGLYRFQAGLVGLYRICIGLYRVWSGFGRWR